MRSEEVDQLISRGRLAELAGANRKTVDVWASRHADFPRPMLSNDRGLISAEESIAWLSRRKVPVRSLNPGEPQGTTYADRVRRNLNRQGLGGERTQDTGNAEGIVAELVGPLGDRIRGTGSEADLLRFLYYLTFVRITSPHCWAELRDLLWDAVHEQRPTEALMEQIARRTDEVLRGQGQIPGARETFRGLRPETPEDLGHVLRLLEGIGSGGAQLLLDRLETLARPESGEFYTPRGVAEVLARTALADAEGTASLFDPAAGSGGMLAAAISSVSGLRASGASPYRASLALAGMNVRLHGGKADLSLQTERPWDNPEPQRRFDYILSNPPFKLRQGSARRQDTSWPFGEPPHHSNTFAWLQYVISSLAPGGRGMVIMPSRAAISEDGRERVIRQRMIESGAVECLIALPPGLFANTAIAVDCWGLAPPRERPHDVLLLDARQMGIKGRRQRELSEEDRDAIVRAHGAWRAGDPAFARHLGERGRAVSVSPGRLREQGYSLSPADYFEDEERERPSGTVAIPLPADALSAVLTEAANADRRIGALRMTDGVRVPRTRAPLGELCEIQSGPSPSRIPKESAEHGVPVIVAAHLRRNRVEAEGAKLAHAEAAAALSRFAVREGDILCVRTGTMGSVALVGVDQTGWIPGTNLIRLRRRTDDVDMSYLLGFLSLPATVRWIVDRASTSSGAPAISASTFGRLQVSLPSLDEQRRIGAALGDLDRQIAAHHDLINAATGLRAALAENLLHSSATLY